MNNGLGDAPRALALAAALAWGAGAAGAEPPAPVHDRVSFAVSAVESVENDRLVAVLFAESRAGSAAAAADEVNEAVRWGLERAAARAGVEARTLGYRSLPLYRDRKLVGWRVRQRIRLEGADAAALGELLGELQSRLAVESIAYELSREARLRAEERLVARALARFRERAALITSELGRRDYRLVQARVATAGAAPPPVPIAARALAAEAAAVAPPALEAGTREVRVEVSGTIELAAD